MKILDVLFNKKDEAENKPKEDSNNNKIKLVRDNGTVLEIQPKYDILGNRLYKTIYDKDTDLVYNFPRYDVKNSKTINGVYCEENYDIYMLLDENKLKNQKYKHFFANVFLESNRLDKIRDVYYGYAGEIRKNYIENNNRMVIEQYVKYLEKNVLSIIKKEAKTGIMSISQIHYYRKDRENKENENNINKMER